MDYWARWELYLSIVAIGWLVIQFANIALLVVIAWGISKIRDWMEFK